jgi:hypothetical protein
MSKWKEIVATVAPTIGASLGGPLGGLGVQVALQALGIEGGTERDLKKAVEKLTPEQYASLHSADLKFKERLAELEVEESKVHQKDRSDARAMRLASGRWTADVLAYLTVFGFFTTLGMLFWYGEHLDGFIKDPLLILIGVLGAAFKDIYQFFFGSSRGSKEKNSILQDNMKDK